MKYGTVFIRFFLASAAFLQCQAAVAGSPDDKPKFRTEYSNPTALVMSPVDEVQNASQNPDEQLSFLYAGIPASLVNLQDSKASILLDECFPPSEGANSSAFIGSVLAYLAPKLVGLFIKEVDKELEKELEKYSQTHKKSLSISPYKSNLEVKSPCFRYTRFTEIKRTNKETKVVQSNRVIEFDFIGQWRVADEQFMQIRPLRFYMRNPSVPMDADVVSIALSVKANGVWRNLNEGRSEDIFQTIVMKEKVKKPAELKAKNVDSETSIMGWTKGMHYFDLSAASSWEKIEALPILPYSKNRSPESAIAKLEISVAEVGDGRKKKTLKFLRKSLKFFEDDLTSVLEEAAKGIFEKEAPVVDDTKYYCATYTATPSNEDGVLGQLQWNDSGDECPSPL